MRHCPSSEFTRSGHKKLSNWCRDALKPPELPGGDLCILYAWVLQGL